MRLTGEGADSEGEVVEVGGSGRGAWVPGAPQQQHAWHESGAPGHPDQQQQLSDALNWRCLKWRDGCWYEGLEAHGSCESHGVVVWPARRERYEGQLRGSVPHGLGAYRWRDGVLYRGEWYDGRMHGCGVLIWKDEHGQVQAKAGKFFDDGYVGPVGGCSSEAAHGAALEADMAAHRARGFEASPPACMHDAFVAATVGMGPVARAQYRYLLEAETPLIQKAVGATLPKGNSPQAPSTAGGARAPAAAAAPFWSGWVGSLGGRSGEGASTLWAARSAAASAAPPHAAAAAAARGAAQGKAAGAAGVNASLGSGGYGWSTIRKERLLAGRAAHGSAGAPAGWGSGDGARGVGGGGRQQGQGRLSAEQQQVLETVLMNKILADMSSGRAGQGQGQG